MQERLRALWPFRRGGPRPFSGQTIIVGVHAGGLGDHLAYSALPRLYKRAGAARVLLSLRTNHGEPFVRNQEIADLIWKLNPFVDGFTEEPANVGETGWPPARFFRAAKVSISPIDTVARVHGLSLFEADGTSRVLPPRPDLFYVPKLRPEFASKVVCDPRSTSQGFSPSAFARFVAFLERWHGLAGREIVVIESRHSGGHGSLTLPDNPRHVVGSIFEYADVVRSAGWFLATEAGGQSLAAAVRSERTHVLISSRAFNERQFVWPGNEYAVTSEMTSGDQEWP